MKTLRIIFTLALTAGTLLFCHGQTVYFGYDVAGNRITRSLTLTKSTAQEDSAYQPDQPEQPEFKDKIGEQDIMIYPNPVQNEITVKIPKLDEGEYASIKVFNQGGQLLYRNDKAGNDNSISFYGLSAGIYYMIIEIKGDRVQWKVVKE